ncbi:MFS transporter [Nocardia sp. NPDC059246]|uniref:MFS transporter n=1 Tax=unclassified Nocardia TaxID=2637762 RepID=UPI0036C4BA5F
MTTRAGRLEDSHRRPTSTTPRGARFAALRSRNFRRYLFGQAVAATGIYVQSIAQGWLVLSLTGDATAVGITTSLALAPTLVFGMAGGWIADRYPKIRVLQATQAAAGTVAAVLAALTLTHHVAAWHIQLLAAVLGTVSAIGWPVRLAFVTELVEDDQMHSAISLNASTLQLGPLAGPALSGVLISGVGPGWAFAVTAVFYVASLLVSARINPNQVPRPQTTTHTVGHAAGGLRALAQRPEIWWPIALVGVFSVFVFNNAVTLASYASTVHTGPSGYALLVSTVAVGSLLGALIAAGRTRITLRGLRWTGCALASAYLVAAAMPTPWSLSVALIAVGIGSQQLYTGANATLQLAAGTALRGRVMGIYILVTFGAGALGGPLLGIIDQHLGPRTGLALAGAIPGTVLLLLWLILVSTTVRPPTQPGTD